MAWDEDKVYIITWDDKKYFYLEIYDKKSLQFIAIKRIYDVLSVPSVGVDSNNIYIGNINIQVFDKKTLQAKGKLYDAKEKVSNIKSYKNYIIAYGEGNQIVVYKDKNLIYSINQKQNYPPNITQIKDYWDYNRVNDVAVLEDILYTANYRGFINMYDFQTGKFLKQINTIKFEKEWGYIVGNNIQDISVYEDRYIYFSIDYEGLMILDTKTNELKNIKTLFPKKIEYNQLFKQDIDMTKGTDIFQLLFYRNNLIFSEVSHNEKNVYVYNLDKKEIVHTFKGYAKNDITEMFIDDDRLIGLGDNGYIFEWDLNRVKNKIGGMDKQVVYPITILAAREGHLSTVKLLLSYGFDLLYKASDTTAFELSIQKGKYEKVDNPHNLEKWKESKKQKMSYLKLHNRFEYLSLAGGKDGD